MCRHMPHVIGETSALLNKTRTRFRQPNESDICSTSSAHVSSSAGTAAFASRETPAVAATICISDNAIPIPHNASNPFSNGETTLCMLPCDRLLTAKFLRQAFALFDAIDFFLPRHEKWSPTLLLVCNTVSRCVLSIVGPFDFAPLRSGRTEHHRSC